MLSLYVHIPFCIRKCNYCDFISFPADEDMQKAYVEALIKEIKLYGRSERIRLASLYFGGGTPSLLPEKLFEQLYSAILDSFDLSEDIEITIEANPGTLNIGKIKLLKSLGVNRISIGVQSLQPDELHSMGRAHNVEDVYKVVQMINSAEIENYSFDFIGGLPLQTEKKLIDTLKQAIELDPKHISLYGLKLEQGTCWDKLDRENKLHLPDEDETFEMMASARELLEGRGYKRYEISNYALKGFKSRHNLQYWLNQPYLGIGLGASSYLKNERFTNVSNIKDYINFLVKQELPVAYREKIYFELEQAETVFLGLRLIEGIELERFKARFGMELTQVFASVIEKHVNLGLLDLSPVNLKLTQRGLEVANEVMLDFLP